MSDQHEKVATIKPAYGPIRPCGAASTLQALYGLFHAGSAATKYWNDTEYKDLALRRCRRLTMCPTIRR